MAAVIILIFIFPKAILPQCKEHFILNQSVTLEGITNSNDNYYQNLIIQDIALAGQQSFREISLRFDYKIHYVTDQCRPEQLEIRVLPLSVVCFPLIYRGYNVSASVKPEKADLIFQLVNFDGFVSDSLIFIDIPLESDSSLYTSLTFARNTSDSNLSVVFSRAVFHYTKSSYEEFRDRILQIDQFYAASLIADSARAWAANGFLSESGIKAEMILRQVELERIIEYIRPDIFNSVLIPGQPDLAGLDAKFQELVRLNNRFKAIIHYNYFEPASSGLITLKKDLLIKYMDRLDYYHELAYKTDFRYVNFIEGLARPDFNNAGLQVLHKRLNRQPGIDTNGLRLWCQVFVQCLIERGNSYRSSGNQLRALTYYQSAYDLSQLMNLHEYQAAAYQLVGLMKNSIATSYLEISGKSALKENPVMAAQYLINARDLFSDKDFICFEPDTLQEFEKWLFLNFESQVIKLIDLKESNKALVYLNEIQKHCLVAPYYPCPGQFHEWMRIARNGIYYDLLNKARTLIAKDELPEAEQVYRQAAETRMRAGYRIGKDVIEEELESSFRQYHYDELMEEGLRDFDKEEFSNALYYFNKAYFQERGYVFRPHPELFRYRQAAARRVMEEILSDGRVKAWAYDFVGAGFALNQVKLMLSEYEFAENDTLSDQYFALGESIHQNECEMVFREYNELMVQAKEARNKSEFILALKITEDAVNLSMDHLSCRVRDDEAWYQKVLLEAPANFQQKEKELEDLMDGSFSDYLKAFQTLKNYYYRNKLLEQGVVFIPLFDRVIRAKDPFFLTGMLDHFITLKDFEIALRILERLREIGYSASLLADQQRSVAESLARRDAMNSGIVEPWKKLDSYTGQHKWYRVFRWSYKLTWLEATNWKLNYWPFIWEK
ncbi:MAG: hypothetical protein WC605_01635 [Bacteroidales bacterium]